MHAGKKFKIRIYTTDAESMYCKDDPIDYWIWTSFQRNQIHKELSCPKYRQMVRTTFKITCLEIRKIKTVTVKWKIKTT